MPVTQVLEDSFVYSCTFEQQHGYEQFVPHYVLAFQFSGETHIQHLPLYRFAKNSLRYFSVV